MKDIISFASDNNAGVHTEIIKALVEANSGDAVAYGADPYTAQATQKIQDAFGGNCTVNFVFNGTAANVLSFSQMLKPYESVICSDVSHINCDECGAPEKFLGVKLIAIPSNNGKISLDTLKKLPIDKHDIHHNRMRVLSITQTTEYGAVYSQQEVKALADYAHSKGLLVHMDGSRIYNAAAALNCSLKEITKDCGVDVLSLGGTKNGLMFGEAVVVFDSERAKDFDYARKQSMQLASKMRFISAQYDRLFTDNLWLTNAQQANSTAKLLAKEISQIGFLEITKPVEANAVFVKVPKELIAKIQEKFFFHVWDEATLECRWMTSFKTTNEDIQGFVGYLKQIT